MLALIVPFASLQRESETEMDNPSSTRLKTGEVRIEYLKLDDGSRSKISTLLMGLKELYGDEESRARLFAKLAKKALARNGTIRRSRTIGLWQIYVLANLRQVLGRDLDYTLHLANHLYNLRDFLGLPDVRGLPTIPEKGVIERRALVANIDLFGHDFIVETSKLIMKSGREVRKRASEAAKLRAAAKRLARAERMSKNPKKSSKNSVGNPDPNDSMQGEFRFDF